MKTARPPRKRIAVNGKSRHGASLGNLTALGAADVVVPMPKQVQTYLRSRPRLARLLASICRRTRAEFGSDAELSLEIYRDPEADDRCLTLYVREEAYGTETSAKIDRVVQDRAEEFAATAGCFVLTTDFRAPGRRRAV